MSSSDVLRDVNSNVQWSLKRKKKVSKRDTIKHRKCAGEPHLNHVGRLVSGTAIGEDCRCSRLKCYTKIPMEQRKLLFESFYHNETKDDQDGYLAGLISYKPVKQRRPRLQRNNDEFLHEVSYSYKVRVGHEEIQICMKAFMNLHGITRGRLRTLQNKIINMRKLPKDGRGKHANRPHGTPSPVIELINCHIKSFKARQSHYSLRDNPHVMYLPESLSIRKMHDLFLNEIKIQVSYQVYYNVFTKDFNIKFGLPRSDTCCICDELNLKIQSAVNDATKNSLIVQKTLHLSKAKKFRELKNIYKEKARQGECVVLSFDYMQNLPMPHIKTGDVFYSRQMWYYVFGIHDLADDSASLYVYPETIGKKGASDVTSLILHYLNNREIQSNHLVLLSDGCSGQNKNHVMVYFQYFVVHLLKLFKKITHIFPIRGHTYLPNDEDFALIAKKKRLHSPEVPADWDLIIRSARKHPSPFKVISVTQDLFFDIKAAVSPYFLRTPRPALQLRKLRVITTSDTHDHIKVKENFIGLSSRCVIRNKRRLPDEWILNPLYLEPLKMSSGKITNLLHLSKFLTKQENRDFFLQFAPDVPVSDDHIDDDVEIEDDDNSEGCEE